MQFITLICFCILASNTAMLISKNNPVTTHSPLLANTLYQDLDEIVRMIPFGSLRQLATRYLLNDEQFQAFVRLINSNDAHVIQNQFRSQPRVIAFRNWVRQQIMLSDGELQLDTSQECVSIFNESPFWSHSVSGWQGIVNEFLLYYPEDMIRSHVQAKIVQNGIFAQFFQRLQDLKPVYDSIIALPVAQRLAAALEATGINTTAIDTFIRNQFGWQENRAVAADILETTDGPAVPVA